MECFSTVAAGRSAGCASPRPSRPRSPTSPGSRPAASPSTSGRTAAPCTSTCRSRRARRPSRRCTSHFAVLPMSSIVLPSGGTNFAFHRGNFFSGFGSLSRHHVSSASAGPFAPGQLELVRPQPVRRLLVLPVGRRGRRQLAELHRRLVVGDEEAGQRRGSTARSRGAHRESAGESVDAILAADSSPTLPPETEVPDGPPSRRDFLRRSPAARRRRLARERPAKAEAGDDQGAGPGRHEGAEAPLVRVLRQDARGTRPAATCWRRRSSSATASRSRTTQSRSAWSI